MSFRYELNRIQRELLKQRPQKLPGVHKKLITFAQHDRPVVEGGMKRNLKWLPMWEDIYNDFWTWIMIVGGRQIFKSTYFSDNLAWAPIAIGKNSIYCTHDDDSKRAFSYEKFRNPVFRLNPNLLAYVREKKTIGDVGRVEYLNGTATYLITDEGGFKHFEGKSPWMSIYDEGQLLDWGGWAKSKEAQATTQGPTRIGGVGAEQGSDYHQMWQTTNQNKWVFKKPGGDYHGWPNQGWRKKLEFNSEGFVWGDYLIDVLEGAYEAQEPFNIHRHGYWLPQWIFPHIPLTEHDATNLYKTDIEYSIEYKLNNYPKNFYMQHVAGEFFEGMKRPITKAMVEALIKPYPYLHMLSPEEVRNLKIIFGHEIVVYLGVDFGSGKKNGKTVITIMIKWLPKPERGTVVPRFQVVYLEDNPPKGSDEQAEHIRDLIVEYDVDLGVGDMGYGAQIIKMIREGGRRRMTGQWYDGVWDKMMGCWSRQDVAQWMADKQSEEDEEGESEEHFLIDKTQSIDLLVDIIKRYAFHPLQRQREREWPPNQPRLNGHPWMWARPQIMIPYAIQRKVRWLSVDLPKIERIDIEEEDTIKPDRRQAARKQYGHPPDAAMSFIYNFVADANWDPEAYAIS